MGLPHPDAVPQLPAAQQLMEVPRRQVLQVSPQHLDELDTPLQRRPVGGVPGRGPGGVFVHDFLQPHQALFGGQVMGVHLLGGGDTLVLLKGLQGRPDGVLELLHSALVQGRGFVGGPAHSAPPLWPPAALR